ncbi:putative polyketide synthase [Jackrogersella minutella]|nr:putative polyketide synthase [Jackrogersella minutella]
MPNNGINGHQGSIRAGVSQQREPIAIVGMGCRLPGDSSSTERLWQLLSNGRSGHCQVPHSRYNASAFYHPDRDRPGSINSATGYFINEDIRNFENGFFGISNIEAISMDPQQRKLLEVVFECFESAGATLEALSGANVGCYVGNFALDFPIMQLSDMENINRYTAAGATPTLLANRISHVFNLQGPSFVLDTGCSSSLYSLHCACTALDVRECDAAVVAGANLIQLPQQQALASKTGIISNSATCRTFDASADGYGRAEGVGALYLKRLSDALREGDPIRAVIRGTAVNSNGRTPGVMQPSADGQERVMRQAYARAGLSVDDTDYVEAHGTGTAVGDPIEVDAISRVFSDRTGRPILIGSVKTNLGHSEATSGITSVIKVVLAMENRRIPATINLETINPKISKPEFNIEIVKSLMTWPVTLCPRASVNSFGFGGANSHAIIEAFLDPLHQQTPAHHHPYTQNDGRTFIIPVSAHGRYSFDCRINDLQQLQLPKPHLNIGAVAYTMSNRRTRFQHRGYMLVDVADSLDQFNVRHASEPRATTSKPSLAFVFTGQGAQWSTMGCNLFRDYEIFRQSIKAQDAHLAQIRPEASWTPLQMFSSSELGNSVDVNQPDVSQVLCTAIQIAIVDLLHDWDIKPNVVIGHSSGEIAAAYAAGYLSRREAIILAYDRGIAVSSRSDDKLPGAMLAVAMEKTRALQYVEELGLVGRISVACVNSPSNVTMSGDADAVQRFNTKVEDLNVFNRKLKTNSVAYHSHHMRNKVGENYQEFIVKHIDFDSPPLENVSGVLMISTVTGHPLTIQKARQPSYWRENLENTVLFHDALSQLFTTQDPFVVEIGPHPALQIPVKEIRASVLGPSTHSDSDAYACTLSRRKDEVRSMLDLAGTMFRYGYEPHFDSINQLQPSEKRVFTSLPTYAWDYQNVVPWKEPRASMELRNRRYRRHELLGSQVMGGSEMTLVWRSIISTHDVPWLCDHKFGSTILFPAAGFISMVIEAALQANSLWSSARPNIFLRQMKLFKALPMPDNGDRVELFTELRKLPISGSSDSRNWWQFNIVSVADGQHASHVAGRVACEKSDEALANRQIILSEDSMELQAMRVWYKRLAEVGFNGGPSFKVIQEVYVDRMKRIQEAHAKLWPQHITPNIDTTDHQEYIAHPTVIDSMLQAGFIASTAGRTAKVQCLIPVSIEEIDVISSSAVDLKSNSMWSIRSKATKTGFAATVADAELHNPDDNVIMRIRRARSTVYQGTWDNRPIGPRVPNLRVSWKPDFTFLDSKQGDQLAAYMPQSRDEDTVKAWHDGLAQCSDLVAHKRPNEKILFLNVSEETINHCMCVLGVNECFRRFAEVQYGHMDEDGKLTALTFPFEQDLGTDSESLSLLDYGVIVVDIKENSNLLQFLHDALSPDATLLLSLQHDAMPIVQAWGWTIMWTTTETSSKVSAIIKQQAPPHTISDEVYLVGSTTGSELNSQILDYFANDDNLRVIFVPFDQLTTTTIPTGSSVILSIEGETSILDQLTPDDLKRLQILTSTASNLLWITCGNLLKADRPENLLSWGAARAIRLEEPQLRFATFDFDGASDMASTASNIYAAFLSAFSSDTSDLEYAEHNGVVHVSRWIPDEPLNRIFQEKQSMQPMEARLEKCVPFQLSIGTPGQLDTIRFDRMSHMSRALVLDEVEIEAKCYGMNAKDLYLLNDRFDVPDQSCSLEFAGVVLRVGPNTKSLAAGDRVLIIAPGRYRNVEIVPEWTCAKLLPTEDFQSTCTLPLVFTTVIYAFNHLAHLRAEESVLIHSATGGVGQAAIQIAKRIGATIFATAGTPEKREWLSRTFEIPSSHIFNSRDSSFLHGVLGATNNRGVDVILNSLSGELLHTSLKACAPLGRFIEIGKKDILDDGRLDMSIFRRSVSFIACDLLELITSGRQWGLDLWQSLIADTMKLFRSGEIQAITPREVFDVSDITRAFRFFAQPSRMGKVVVSMEDPNSVIQLTPNNFDSHFDAKKTYLMIGCFGGIGSSIARWMLSRGAKNMVFLSRSGASKQSAANLVSDLESAGCQVQVVSGDVSNMNDVKQAFSTASTEIGGIVHASMSVKATHWNSLTCEDWHYGIAAKVQGTRNLHNALADGHESSLDFFLLFSSISGTIGSPTEPSYCAANSYMDSFARHRRARGLKAISLALGVITEVGYLHEHADREAIFTRRGLQPTNEDELLQLVDLAIAHPDSNGTPGYDRLMRAHLLTGLEMQVAKAQALDPRSTAFDILFQDPRAGLLKASFDRDVGDIKNAAPVSKAKLTQQIQEAVLRGESLQIAVSQVLATKFSNIIMLPPEQFKHDQPLVNFGLDSMLAAEFRTFIFQATQVDLPFMTLLSKKVTMDNVVTTVVEQIQ